MIDSFRTIPIARRVAPYAIKFQAGSKAFGSRPRYFLEPSGRSIGVMQNEGISTMILVWLAMLAALLLVVLLAARKGRLDRRMA